MPKQPLAIILGDSDLLRPLVMADIPCAIAAAPGSPLTYSRHVRHVVEWSEARPIDGQVERLIEFARDQEVAPCLFYQSDRQLLWVSRNRERLQPVLRFVIAEQTVIEDLVDKARFRSFAERHRLPVPLTALLIPGDQYAVHGDPPMPAVLKPVTRSTDSRWPLLARGRKAISVGSLAELEALRPDLERYGEPLLLQQAIPGPERRIESYHTYVDEDGEIVADFTGRKLRTIPVESGATTAVEVVHIPDLHRAGREVVTRIGLTGAAKLDFKRSPTGELHLLEINPRLTLWNHAGAAAGINIPAIIYADLAGRPRPPVQPPPYRASWVCTPDLAAARADGGTLKWLWWLARTRPVSAFSVDDLRPALQFLRRHR